MGIGKATNKVQQVVLIFFCPFCVISTCYIFSVYNFIHTLLLIHPLFSFDELLELSQRGDNRTIDMLVGDIYGGMDYSKVYLTYHLFFLLPEFVTGMGNSKMYQFYD